METSEVPLTQKWNKEDIRRVDSLVRKDGVNLLPRTKDDPVNLTWYFYETFIHILEGDTDFDFQDLKPDELRQIDWQELKIVAQKARGEEPEEYDESVSVESKQNLENMRNVRDFLVSNFGKDFDLPDPESLERIK